MINKDCVFNSISFVSRYKALCEKYSDFENRLRGNHLELYDKVLEGFSYPFKYVAKDKVYKVQEERSTVKVILQLVLQDGLVEPSITIKENNEFCSPFGRFDFIPERMNVDFDREQYNLPIYSNKEELKQILQQVFLIYEDIISELNK